ncbi:MAG: cell wall metabolism sensor histidine kinase WalK [Peptococcaceae bacterium]|jgi:two-component system sensor histidine kinase ResE|nr:cell wall metabolism sensor histidine kinase WalK [Peptococcaceae bacterium]
MTLLILMVLGGLGVTITWLFGDFYLQSQLKMLQGEAAEIAAQLAAEPDWNSRYSLLNTMKLTSGVQLVILDQNGNPAVISGDFKAVLPPARTRLRPIDFLTTQNIADVMAGKALFIINKLPDDPEGQAMLLSLVPIGKTPVLGAVIMGKSPEPVQQSIQTFNRLIFIASLVAIILATMISLLLARQLTRPLASLQKAARRLAEGKFEVIQDIKSKDELGQLAESFNTMAQSLQKQTAWLLEQRNLLQGIVESMSDGVIMLSPQGEIRYVNDAARAFWQNGEEEQQERKSAILQSVEKTFAQNDPLAAYILTLGTQILEISVAPIQVDVPTEGYVAVFRDITASLRAEKERRDFQASITHELRTPLHLIQGYLEAIQDGVIPAEEQAENIDLILSETKRLARLVQELQDMSRLEHYQTLNCQAIDIRAFFQELSQRFTGPSLELGIELRFVPLEGVCWADHDRLLQVFINLLDNALRYTHRGGLIQILTEQADGRARFVVKDNGEGIPREKLPQIFDKFYRVQKARTRKEGGMGLGLAIVKQIVEAHGGTIKIESELGQGTVFILEFPAESVRE